MTASIDKVQFRNALGAFTTGVTIVTTRGKDGNDYGLTANSFNSVSLDPPMVLWSLSKTSGNLQGFASAGHFAVHVLAADQEATSNRFAKSGAGQVRGHRSRARAWRGSVTRRLLRAIRMPNEAPVRRRRPCDRCWRSHQLR